MIAALIRSLFGNDRNILRDTVEVFRENAEAGAKRAHDDRSVALEQFAADFAQTERGGFDRAIDGINRLPRPLLAFATLALLISAMVDPFWFAKRMEGLLLVPEPLWWLLGVIVSFYFGARHQAKSQDFQRSLAEALARLPERTGAASTQPQQSAIEKSALPTAARRVAETENAALNAWRDSERHKGADRLQK
jgi:hypothetical protein